MPKVFTAYLASAALCVLAGLLVVSGGPGARYHTTGLVALATALIVLAALFLSANTVFAVSFVVFAASQLSKQHPLHVGHITVYAVDALFALMLLRSVSPRQRDEARFRFAPKTRLAVMVWLAVMAAAALHGWGQGVGVSSVLRIFAPTVYLFGFYIAFSRLAREPGFDPAKLLRHLVAASVALVGFMLTMRVLHHPFENPSALGPDGKPIGNQLARVVAANGTVFHRDYGFSSAYIVYPALALTALAALTGATERRRLWTALFAVGTVATLTTLVRGDIYGLAAGAVVMVAASGAARSSATSIVSRRMNVLAGTALVLCISLLGLALVAPKYASAVIQRSVPFTAQSQNATSTANYRLQAITGATSEADRHPFGRGFVPDATLVSEGLDPGFIAHSSVAYLLIYAGWPGLIAALLATLAVIGGAFKRPSAPAWVARAAGAIGVLLVVSSLGGVGVFGQIEVAGLAALLLAARFAATPAS